MLSGFPKLNCGYLLPERTFTRVSLLTPWCWCWCWRLAVVNTLNQKQFPFNVFLLCKQTNKMNSFNLVAAEMSIDFLYSDHSDVAS